MTPARPRAHRALLAYVVAVGLPLLALLAVLRLGAGLHPTGAAPAPPAPLAVPPPPVAAGAGAAALDVPLLLLQVAVVLAAARLAGRAARHLGQPQVVGEMLAGILLGPSVLGALAPAAAASLFPPASLGFLNALSQLGLVLFMFVVGLELDPALLRGRGRTALVTSHASIAVPFVLGAALAILLYPTLAPRGVPFAEFALFMGAAMSVTAFPVLARILTERRLVGTRLGAVALACAAVDDATAWCILAGVVALVRAPASTLPLWATAAGTILLAALVLGPVRRALDALGRRVRADGRLGEDVLALLLLAALAAAWTTERLGVHALFGAFLVGVAVPKRDGLAAALSARFQDLMVVLLLPLFFAFTGLRTRVGLIAGGTLWAWCGLVTAVAVAGKFGGSALAARATGMAWREAGALGALMNTRGLMELVILNVGLDLGVLSPTLFAMMVLMALATTLMTTPLLERLYPETRAARARAPAPRAAAPAGR